MVDVVKLTGGGMARGIAGVAGGLVVWIVVATLGNLVLRAAWAGYAEVEKAMTFTLGMMLGRLIVSAVASLCAGLTVAWVTKRNDRFAPILAVVLVVLFVPVHYELWSRFPVWYHLVFFALLAGMALLGAKLPSRVASSTEEPASRPVLPGPDDSA